MYSKLLSAGALALVIGVAVPGLAQVQQLNDSAMTGLIQLGIGTDELDTITADQAAQIENVLGGSAPDDEKIASINVILGHPDDALVPQPLAVDQLKDSVTADMVKLGLGNRGVDSLTVEGLAQIESVVNSAGSDESKRAQIEEILGNSEAAVGGGGERQLSDSASAGLVMLGIDTAGLDALSVSQLAQIENVVGSSDADDTKRGQIERIMSE